MRLYEIEAGKKVKIYEIEAGQKEKLDLQEADQYCELIQRDCSDALAEMQKAPGFLFRGFQGYHGQAFKGSPRTDRRPRNTKKKLDAAINDMLATAGFKALRSNSIFCTGNAIDAKSYTDESGGSTYIIFPINGFDYTWSRESQDLFIGMNSDDMRNLESGNYEPVLEKFQFTNIDLNQAIAQDYEVSISGLYYAFEVSTYAYYFAKKLLGH